ncbi:MAG: hypothetical protein MI757_11910 [Pirellulales bacterium]|nr:hypothetical protein [Pirellulales bacterium]
MTILSSIGRFLVWLLPCLIWTLVVTWFAAQARQIGYAPPILFAIVTGVILGFGIVACLRVSWMIHFWTGVLTTCIMVAICNAGQAYVIYFQDFGLEALEDDTKPTFVDETRRKKPRPTFSDFIRGKVSTHLMRWTFDSMLILATTLLVVVPTLKQPACKNCSSWYRTRSSGMVDGESAQAIAKIAGIVLPGDPTSAQYRILGCREECGPPGLELFWDSETDAGKRKGRYRIWIDKAKRRRILRLVEPAEEQQA